MLKNLLKNILPYGVVMRIKTKSLSSKEFKEQFDKYSESLKDNRFLCNWEDINPRLNDNTNYTNFDSHYLYHPAWAARILKKTNPNLHIDISSSVYFVSYISAFINIDFYDYRPAKIKLSGLNCKKADITKLHFENNSIDSISCMHVIEHVGLGRYGDPIDPKGDIKSINELQRVTKKDGDILFVVPVGKISKIEFNAHRIYSFDHIINLFDKCRLIEFALVTDDGNFIENASKKDSDNQSFGCGCFYFKKN
ncbi:MAG: hypothetical protein KatS3mg068_1165 [Candidatus Sericytochromatia bacterium]|nr:MAG: hypothetical protein KatS3mg068_1165 [Candidatus Sericytochromatia bacterium]